MFKVDGSPRKCLLIVWVAIIGLLLPWVPDASASQRTGLSGGILEKEV